MKVIITGSTGMVGKAALIECIEHEAVTGILVINRSPLQMKHSKLKELIHKDFTDFTPLEEQLMGYDACFHCMGVSSVGMSEKDFTHFTYDMTKALAELLYKLNPDMVFCYISGTGTDSTENGRVMWARVKGRTENLILNMGFKDAYAFRPGVILPEKGVKSKTAWYNALYVIMRPLFPLMRRMNSVALSSVVGKALINSVLHPQKLKHLENKDINRIGRI